VAVRSDCPLEALSDFRRDFCARLLFRASKMNPRVLSSQASARDPIPLMYPQIRDFRVPRSIAIGSPEEKLPCFLAPLYKFSIEFSRGGSRIIFVTPSDLLPFLSGSGGTPQRSLFEKTVLPRTRQRHRTAPLSLVPCLACPSRVHYLSIFDFVVR